MVTLSTYQSGRGRKDEERIEHAHLHAFQRFQLQCIYFHQWRAGRETGGQFQAGNTAGVKDSTVLYHIPPLNASSCSVFARVRDHTDDRSGLQVRRWKRGGPCDVRSLMRSCHRPYLPLPFITGRAT